VDWWQTFFDAEYVRLWSRMDARAPQQAEAISRALGLAAGMRVLDAPCGYGRLSLPLAGLGLEVLGVDQSQPLLDEAERRRENLWPKRLRYLRHDLRAPLPEDGFDAALNVFTSIGYGSEDDDVAVLRTLAAAVRPGAPVLVETMHRDLFVTILARGGPPAQRIEDGTLLVEEPRFDPLSGRIEITSFWSGPSGSGRRTSSLRLYSITELVRLLERAGLRLDAALSSESWQPFVASGANAGGRVALVARRAAPEQAAGSPQRTAIS
jgi:SAM-dependent methyltransferase